MLTAYLLIFTMMALTRANNVSEVLSINSTKVLSINSTEVLAINSTLTFGRSKFRDVSCPNKWDHYNGRCFHFVMRRLTWAQAEKNCQSMDANLVTIHSIEEYHTIQSFIQDSTAEDKNTWIGGSDCQETNTWLWIDGEPFKFRAWCPGQPDSPYQNCIQINYGGGKCWDNLECDSLLSSLCAKMATGILSQHRGMHPTHKYSGGVTV